MLRRILLPHSGHGVSGEARTQIAQLSAFNVRTLGPRLRTWWTEARQLDDRLCYFDEHGVYCAPIGTAGTRVRDEPPASANAWHDGHER
jgi:hypothetical protein